MPSPHPRFSILGNSRRSREFSPDTAGRRGGGEIVTRNYPFSRGPRLPIKTRQQRRPGDPDIGFAAAADPSARASRDHLHANNASEAKRAASPLKWPESCAAGSSIWRGSIYKARFADGFLVSGWRFISDNWRWIYLKKIHLRQLLGTKICADLMSVILFSQTCFRFCAALYSSAIVVHNWEDSC